MAKRTSQKRGLDAARHMSAREQSTLTPLNFRVAQEFHREFKTFAAQHSKKMVEVLQEAFALLKEKYGS